MGRNRKKNYILAIMIFLILGVIISFYMLLIMVARNSDNSSYKPQGVKGVTTGRVLFISSYSESFESVPLQLAGINEVMNKNNITLDAAYMDSRNFTSKENEALFTRQLKYKLANTDPYDVILIGDDTALGYFEKHQNDMFKNIPCVFFGINDLDHAERAAKNPLMTGAAEYNHTVETVDLASKLFPESKNVYYAVDNSVTGIGDQEQMNLVREKYPDYDYHIINISNLTEDEFKKSLSDIPRNSIFLFLSAFTDKNGKTYSIPQSVEIMNKTLSVPVFRCSIGGVGNGCLGGIMTDYREMGKHAAETAVKIINGTPVSSFSLRDKEDSVCEIDYKILKKYKLSTSSLPSGTEYINYEESFIQKNQGITIVSGIIVTILTFILVIMLVAYIKSHIYAERLSDSMNQLEYALEHDDLTGLPNRRKIVAEADTLNAGEYSAMVMDIDDFKTINDNFGHSYGDVVLEKIGERLNDFLADKDAFCARCGGDEFVILYHNIDISSESSEIKEVMDIFRTPVNCSGYGIPVNCSIGIVNNDKNRKTTESLISDAEIAMFVAKRRGKNTFVFFNEDMKKAVEDDSDIRQKIASSIHSGGFYMLYQPQVNVNTLEVSGYEALIRMKNENIGPGQFIPIAEKYGMISEIGRLITRLVVSDMSKCIKKGFDFNKVSLNYSCGQINDKGYIKYLKETLDEFNIPYSKIEIEITESLFLDNSNEAMELFKALKDLDISIALDDFGTGFSSLNYLTYIPIDYMKLDKSMVDNYLVPGKEIFIEDLVNMAHHLHKGIIVEGIEHKWQYEQMKQLNGDYIQGYYFSKPISVEEILEFKPEIKDI